MVRTNYALLDKSIYNSQAEKTALANNAKTTKHGTENKGASSLGNDEAAVFVRSNPSDYEVATYTSFAATRATSTSTVLKVGSTGTAVKTLQTNLKTLGYLSSTPDGIFGNATKNAVIAFQKAYGLTADGIVGSATQNAITKALDAHNKGVLSVGSRGTAVTTLQSDLKTLGYSTSSPDGIFGNGTKNAVITFQKAYGLTADGIVGSETKAAIAKAIEYKNKGILTVGSRGDDVKTLQANLKTLGYISDAPDGIFGNGTKNAVIAFQKAYGLTADGIVGASTKKAIADAIANIGNNPTTPSTPPSTSGIPQFQGHDDLGYLSSKFEAHGDCGTISTGNGDSGGKSYGLYQFASNAGTPKSFVNWLKNKDTDIYNKLNNAYNADGGCGSNFDQAWKSIAATDTDRFSELQYNYTKEKYYDASVAKIKENLNFDVTKRGYTLNAVIWSRAVQMGGCGTIFTRAVAGLDLSTASDEDIIRAIYKENSKVTSTAPYSNSNKIKEADGDKYGITGKYLYYFSRNSSNVQAGVYNRLTNTELNEALKLLKNYG